MSRKKGRGYDWANGYINVARNMIMMRGLGAGVFGEGCGKMQNVGVIQLDKESNERVPGAYALSLMPAKQKKESRQNEVKKMGAPKVVGRKR